MRPPDIEELRIVHYPAPVLKKVSAPVEEFGPEIKALADRMLEIMHQGEGVGLAAPQVGVSLRMFVCNHTGEAGDDRVFLNPHFTELTGAEEKEEGCLSFPGVTITKRRATRVKMDAVDTAGSPIHMVGEDLIARIWQHETDHLDGTLIVDNMSATDEIANRRAIKRLITDYKAGQRSPV
jgi:peptide deformylase